MNSLSQFFVILILLPIKYAPVAAAVAVDTDDIVCDVTTHDVVGDELNDDVAFVVIHPIDGYVERQKM